MTATAEIMTEERNNVLLVPNAALRFKPNTGGDRDSTLVGSLTPRGPRSLRGPRSGQQGNIGRGSKQTVYILDEKGEPKAIEITEGASNGRETEGIKGGLTAGMQEDGRASCRGRVCKEGENQGDAGEVKKKKKWTRKDK